MDRGQMVGIKAVWKVCWDCDECNAGEDALCRNALSSGCHKNGTFQEYSIGPASYVTPIPEGVDPLIAAPLMVISTMTLLTRIVWRRNGLQSIEELRGEER